MRNIRNRVFMKKIYIEPKIKAIELDPRQAVLEACKIGGQYFGGATECMYLIPATDIIPCPLSIKGTKKSIGPGTSRETNAQPS